MPSFQDKKDFVIKKIQEANPEIMELKFGCLIDWGVYGIHPYKWTSHNDDEDCLSPDKMKHNLAIKKILGRDIRLADILTAIDMAGDYSVGSDGTFYEYDTQKLTWITFRIRYDLIHDSLDWHAEHRPELIEWLYEILK